MNFLAHIYLSGDNELLTIGNFVADGIRGNQFKGYPEPMQAGIVLHRFIDSYTDTHPVFKKSTKKLHANYGHYSGVIIDIFYDHFLAKNWNQYTSTALTVFVEDFYHSLNRHLHLLPSRFQHLTPIMIEGNWLLSYASIEGIQLVLNGMNKRTKGRSQMHKATTELLLHYDVFENEFFEFFEDLTLHTNAQRKIIENQFDL